MKKKALFTIKRIRNRNPRLPRLYRDTGEKIWRLAVVVLLAVVGVASLFMFGGNLEGENLNTQVDAQLLEAALEPEEVDDWRLAESTREEPNDFLGSGFEDITKFSGGAKNSTLDRQGDLIKKVGGIGIINAMLYNVKDYFKYVAGGIAILYLIISATHIVTAVGDEGIEKGKKNLKWGIMGLVTIFAIDAMVVTFFEGGGTTPGGSLFTVDAEGSISENTPLFENISVYFKANAQLIFSYVKTLAGAFAILFIFLAGSHMISAAGNEEKIEKEKKFLIHAITAFVTLLALEQMIFGFIYPDNKQGVSDPICVEFMNFADGNIIAGEHNVNLMMITAEESEIMSRYGISEDQLAERITQCKSATALGNSGSEQVLGIVRFFESLIGGIAIFFMVYSGVSIISSMGNEELVTKHKKTLIWSLAGLAVIVLSETLVMRFFFIVNSTTGSVSIDSAVGLASLAGVTNFIATLVGIFSVISIIVAGMLWVANFGNTEIADKSKKVILGAILGVILSISAYAIVNSITLGNSEGEGGSEITIEI
jgi:hypothetical protein